MNAHRLAPRAAIAALLMLPALLAAPTGVFASCIQPDVRTFMADPANVVIAGTVVQVGPNQVSVEVQRWWGEGPQTSVLIERPPTDPGVITSTDWNPAPGEAAIILATRGPGALKTAVCHQLPGDAQFLADIRSSLGDGVVPQASAAPDPAPQPEATSTQASGAIALAALGAVALLGAIAGVWLAMRRRRAA